jgi:hypothetical protein
MAAQAQYRNKPAERRILFAKSDLKTEFVVTFSLNGAALTIPYFGILRIANLSDRRPLFRMRNYFDFLRW